MRTILETVSNCLHHMSWQQMAGQVKVAAQSLATLNTILDELAPWLDLGAYDVDN